MAARPLISIIVPTFNRVRYLREAVQSVRAQTYDRWELLIVDDGSTDGTGAYLETITDPRVRSLLRGHCGNGATARNTGIASASGSHLAFLDSDDFWDPEKLALQMAELDAHPACRWGYTGFQYVDQEGHPIGGMAGASGTAPSGWILEDVLERRAHIPPSATVVERQFLESVGGFDASLWPGEDLDLWMRLAEVSPAAVVSKPLVRMRRHPGNHCIGTLELLEGRNRTYERALARTSSPRVRRLCRREQVRVSLDIAATARRAGEYAEARRVLWTTFAQAGWHPRWYIAVLKTWLRPWLPRWLLSRYRKPAA